MKIDKIKGKHSEDDEIILVTAKKEAITLSEVAELVHAFATNELRRIRSPKVREEIIKGKRRFMFKDIIKETINIAKNDELWRLKNE